MKSFILDLLSEKSTLSALRVMSLTTCYSACLIAFYGVYKQYDASGIATICGVFLTAAFTGKVVQKNIELRKKE
jgi:hypothetical protein